MNVDSSCAVELGFAVESWNSKELGNVVVYHKEQFRIKWFATKLVIYVYIIDSTPTDYVQTEIYYDLLMAYARTNKKSILPRGLQLGYALLPIYIGSDFSSALIEDVKTKFIKKWCVFHVPSLYDAKAGELISWETRSYWGIIYAGFIRKTIEASARGIQ